MRRPAKTPKGRQEAGRLVVDLDPDDVTAEMPGVLAEFQRDGKLSQRSIAVLLIALAQERGLI